MFEDLKNIKIDLDYCDDAVAIAPNIEEEYPFWIVLTKNHASIEDPFGTDFPEGMYPKTVRFFVRELRMVVSMGSFHVLKNLVRINELFKKIMEVA